MLNSLVLKVNMLHGDVVPFAMVVAKDSARNICFIVADAVIPSDAEAMLFIRKPSGIVVGQDCKIGSTVVDCHHIMSMISAKLPSNAIDEVGEAEAQIRVTKGDKYITTFKFYIRVKENFTLGEYMPGEDSPIPEPSFVFSVNGKTGHVQLSAADLDVYTKAEVDEKLGDIDFSELEEEINALSEKVQKLDTEKMSYYRVTLENKGDGLKFYHNDDAQTFEELVEVFNNPKYFLYLFYTNLVFIPAFDVESDNPILAFSSAWSYSDTPHISRVSINADGEIHTDQFELENAENRVVTRITGRNTDEVHYPSTQVLVDYTKEQTENLLAIDGIYGMFSEDGSYINFKGERVNNINDILNELDSGKYSLGYATLADAGAYGRTIIDFDLGENAIIFTGVFDIDGTASIFTAIAKNSADGTWLDIEYKIKPVGGKIQIDYNAAENKFSVDGAVINFKQIHDYLLESDNFVFVLHGDRAYLCSYLKDDEGSVQEIRFESVINSEGVTKTSSIYITSADGVEISSVSVSNINSENQSNKIDEITDDNKESATLYPSVKAITDYTQKTVFIDVSIVGGAVRATDGLDVNSGGRVISLLKSGKNVILVYVSSIGNNYYYVLTDYKVNTDSGDIENAIFSRATYDPITRTCYMQTIYVRRTANTTYYSNRIYYKDEVDSAITKAINNLNISQYVLPIKKNATSSAVLTAEEIYALADGMYYFVKPSYNVSSDGKSIHGLCSISEHFVNCYDYGIYFGDFDSASGKFTATGSIDGYGQIEKDRGQ